MRWVLGVVCAALLAGCASSGGGTGSGVGASCVAPELAVAPATVVPDHSLVVTGDYFFATCNDTSANGEAPPEPEPLRGLTVLLRQQDRTWTLAEDVDASGPRWSIEVRAQLPSDVEPGPAEVLVPDHGRPVAVTVRAAE